MGKPVIPDVYTTIGDGALGTSLPATDNVHVKIGAAASGTNNQLMTFTSVQQVKDTLVAGPLAEALAYHLSTAGGPVYAVKAATSTAASVGALTKAGTGTATGATTGTVANDTYDVIAKVVKGGATLVAATATMKISLDGGDTYGPEVAIPSGGTYNVPNTGIAIVFTYTSGTAFVAGDTFSFKTVAPAMTLADLNAAIDVLLADPREWGWLHVVGDMTATTAAGVDVKMTAAENVYRFAFALVEARDLNTGTSETEAAWMTALLSGAEWGNFASKRVSVSAGYEELTSPLTGRIARRSSAWSECARIGQTAVSQSPAEVELGPLQGVTKLFHDEQAVPGLDAGRFNTNRTIIGRQGFYMTSFRMFAPSGSDFTYGENRRVMDKACKVARDAALKFGMKRVKTDPKTGFVLEAAAKAIETYVNAKLNDELVNKGDASEATVVMNRTDNILSTRSTGLKVRVQPVGYIGWLELDIAFANPALSVA